MCFLQEAFEIVCEERENCAESVYGKDSEFKFHFANIYRTVKCFKKLIKKKLPAGAASIIF